MMVRSMILFRLRRSVSTRQTARKQKLRGSRFVHGLCEHASTRVVAHIDVLLRDL